MLFPVVIHKEPDSCFGVTIPDIPGCFTAGDTIDEAIRNIQEAVACHLHDAVEAPQPSPIERHLANPDYGEGIWAMIDIDFSFLAKKHKRINITVPEDVLRKIDAVARHRGMSRSAFLVQAAQKSCDAAADPPSRR